MTRDERIAAAAAKAMADEQDRRERRDAFREGRQEINDALRGFAGPSGPGRSTLDPTAAMSDQILAADERRKGSTGGEPIAPARTREEINADMNAALRAQLRRGSEEEN